MADRKPIYLTSSGIKTVFQTGDTLAISHGGTGATTQAAARTALGLTIGTDIQAFSNSLTAVAALSGTGFAVKTGTATWTTRQVAGTSGRITVSNGDGVAGNATLDLATLSDGGGGSFLKFTRDAYGRVSGTSAVTSGDITAFTSGLYILKAGDTMTGALTLSGNPSSALHAATKQYVDALLGGGGGYTGHTWVRVASAGNINIASPGSTIDGITMVNGDLVLLKDQSTGSQNGIYVWNGSAVPMTRHSDYDGAGEINPGLFVFVSEGTTNGDNGFTLITDAPITVGTTSLTFIQTSGAGQIVAGNGIQKTGNILSVVTASSSRISVTGSGVDLAALTIGGSGVGTFTKFTVDTYGRITSTATATPADIGAQPADADLTALAGLSSTGVIIRSASNTFTSRTLTGTARISITNGDGISGNPTFDLPTGVNTSGAGTYNSVTVDTYGRVTSGSTVTVTDITGNAGTATALETPRNINGVAFDGTADISINTNSFVAFNASGTGGAPGIQFNGSTNRLVSYNTIGAAPIVSPVFLGIPQADTAAYGNASTQLATTQFVQSAIDGIVGDNTFYVHAAPPPSTPIDGDRWLCTDNGVLYTYFNDGDSSQWAELERNITEDMVISPGLPIINPTIPKEGDYRIIGSTVQFYIDSSWQQVYPPAYA